MQGRFSYYWSALLMINGGALGMDAFGFAATRDSSFLWYGLLALLACGLSFYMLKNRAEKGE